MFLRVHASRILTVLLLGAAAPACADAAAAPAPPRPPPPTATQSAHEHSPVPSLDEALFPNGLYGVPLDEPVEKVDFTLTDQNGRPFHFLEQTQGKVTLLFFGYTHCPDICPGTMGALTVAMRSLPEDVTDRIAVVFVTVDPARDTPEALTEWIANFDTSYTALSGNQNTIVRVQESFGVKPATREDYGGGQYGMNHAAYVLAFTTDGYAHAIYPFGMTVERFAHDLPILVEEGWKEI